jgi:hypothetical protein
VEALHARKKNQQRKAVRFAFTSYHFSVLSESKTILITLSQGNDMNVEEMTGKREKMGRPR